MAKTKEELQELKGKILEINQELKGLSDEDLQLVTGGTSIKPSKNKNKKLKKANAEKPLTEANSILDESMLP